MKTISNVPILETGIEYQTSTGAYTFTAEDLADMVQSQNDAAIVVPRLKLGHTDPRFNGKDGEPMTLDGEPAFGTAQNLRLENGGNTVVCDYVGVPDWLAEILPEAYPNRSIEGLWDVETVTGKKWRFVCTDVALLGVIWPGISTLDDLQTALSDDGPEGVEVGTVVAASSTWDRFSKQLHAQVNLEDVRRGFYDEVATEESGRYWWWVRAVLIEPDELICDDDDGGLFRVPFNINGESVTFGDPVPVKVNYVDAPEEVAATRVMAAVYERPNNRRKIKMANVDLTLLRKVLGLPEDASEEDVNAKLAEREQTPAAGGEPEPTAPPATPESETAGEQPTPTEEERAAAAAAAASGVVSIDRGTLDELQRQARLGASAHEAQRVASRDAFLQAALNDGKFPPNRLEHWRNAWESEYKALGNSDGIKATVEAMPKGLIPVTKPIGGQPAGEGDAGEAYPSSWLPEVAARRQAQTQATRVVQEA